MCTNIDTSSTTQVSEMCTDMDDEICGRPLAGLLWERPFEKVLLGLGWKKIPNWACLFVHLQQGLFLSVHVDDKKWLE